MRALIILIAFTFFSILAILGVFLSFSAASMLFFKGVAQVTEFDIFTKDVRELIMLGAYGICCFLVSVFALDLIIEKASNKSFLK